MSRVLINFPNSGEIYMDIESVCEWDFESIRIVGDIVFFQYYDVFLSISLIDYDYILSLKRENIINMVMMGTDT